MVKFDCDGKGRDFRLDTMYENREFLYHLVTKVRPECIVELGTFFGCSYFSMLQAIKDNGWDTELHAVDHFKGDTNMPGYEKLPVEKTFKGILEQIRPQKSRFKVHKKSFDAALKQFDDNSLDILLIDGDHRYDAVKHDFEVWRPKLKKNGIVIFHDTNVLNQATFGVNAFFNELKCAKVAIANKYGLGLAMPHSGQHNGFAQQRLEAIIRDNIFYTAVYGGYDHNVNVQADIVMAYKDAPLEVPEPIEDPRLRAKHWKVLPHLHHELSGYEYTAWIDGNVVITDPEFMKKVVGRMKVDRSPLALFRHPDRRCLYEEYEVCKKAGFLKDPEKARKQVARYHDANFPRGAGLWCGTIIFRRHMHPDVVRFNNLWWREIRMGSVRDQISLPYVMKEVGIKPTVIPGSLWSNKWFRLVPHAKDRRYA